MQDDLVNKVLDSAIENFRRQSRTSSYKSNPRQWCKDVLGIDLWSKQEDQFLALLENDHVAVRSAHGTGKSFNAALVACWWVSTRYDMGEDVIVVTTAPTFHQVSAILWENIRKFHMLAIVTGKQIGRAHV